MKCYDCDQERVESVALGVCHICGAGLCAEHTRETKQAVKANQAFFARVTVDPPQRQLSCHKCAESIAARDRTHHSPLKLHN